MSPALARGGAQLRAGWGAPRSGGDGNPYRAGIRRWHSVL